MERSPRLRKYLRKDYSQVVEFPVEIVGRDNLVRRYSFDDAVRLYHRRIQSAPVRYDDPDTIAAEVRHCRQRIEQLRRSYLEHSGWGRVRGRVDRGVLAGPLAAEVASFLRRVFGDDPAVVDAAQIELVERGDVETWFLRVGARTYVLYAYRLDARGPVGARAALRRDLDRLRAAPADGGLAERLFVSAIGPDLALLLAGTGTWEGAPSLEREPVEPVTGGGPEDADFGREGLRAMHDGNLGEALRWFERGAERVPERLALAQSAALLALLAQDPERAEFAARFGLLNHADDPFLAYLLAVAMLEQRKEGEIAAILERAPARDPRFLLLRGVLALRAGRPVRAWRMLATVPRVAPEELWCVVRASRLVRGAMLRAAGAVVLAAASIAGAGAAGQLGAWVGAVALVAAAPVLVVSALVRLRAEVRGMLAGAPRSRVRLVSPEMLPREREAAGRM